MNEFICDKCGLCCESLNKNSIYKDLDDGTGTCKYFNKNTRLCNIYEKRPIKCNVKAGYELFKDVMSYSEYIKLNYDACKRLKERI